MSAERLCETPEPESRRIRQECDDAACVAGLIRGDRDAIRDFFHRRLRPVILRAERELFGGFMKYDDLVGELYIHLSEDRWRRLRSFSAIAGCSLRTWGCLVAWRLFLNRRRSLGAAPEASCAVTEDVRSPDAPVMSDIRMDVASALSRMPNRRYAAILSLLMVQGYTPEEVGHMLDISVDNVYMSKHRALRQFAECYSA